MVCSVITVVASLSIYFGAIIFQIQTVSCLPVTTNSEKFENKTVHSYYKVTLPAEVVHKLKNFNISLFAVYPISKPGKIFNPIIKEKDTGFFKEELSKPRKIMQEEDIEAGQNSVTEKKNTDFINSNPEFEFTSKADSDGHSPAYRIGVPVTRRPIFRSGFKGSGCPPGVRCFGK